MFERERGGNPDFHSLGRLCAAPTSAEMGQCGEKARAKALSAKRREGVATKASRASARARTRKAQEREIFQSEKFSR